ncbi:MAG: helix-turn-helix domain-containing protein [Gemmatimonadales bacterium]|nr:helix-turn-helix domain-containing protein [Gemmatimonadales bacterium]
MSHPKPSPVTPVASLEHLGQAVRARRKSDGLRIDDAAAYAGVSVDLLSRLENGHSGVTTARLIKVLDALGLALVVVDKSRLPALDRALASTPGDDPP